MGYTLVEKIFARAAGKSSIAVGEIVNVGVDRLLINDWLGPIVFSQFESLGVPDVVNPDRVLFGLDHRVPPADVKFANNHKLCREKCQQYGIDRFADIGRHGIGHQLMVEHFTLPGEVALGTDSHATMYGGIGALACGITSSDAAVIMATGQIWLQVPPTIRIDVNGKLPIGVTAKDIALAMIQLAPLHTFIYKAIEIGGETIRELSVSGRLVIANMVAEMNAKCGIIEADEKTIEFVGVRPNDIYIDRADSDATYEMRYEIDASSLVPLVACPHSVDNIKPVTEVAGTIIHQAFLGSCTNGRIEDFEQALTILRGRQIHKKVRMLVVPASQSIMLEATRRGLIEELLVAGAAIMTPSCASCAGSGPGLIGAGERAISSTNRNFKGRMGSPDSEVYLTSAYVVAASAVTGAITDPRQFL